MAYLFNSHVIYNERVEYRSKGVEFDCLDTEEPAGYKIKPNISTEVFQNYLQYRQKTSVV